MESGLYADESDVVRDALRAHEERKRRDFELLEALRADVAEADAGQLKPYSMKDIIAKADAVRR